ncbi:MAG: hypothetical protein COT73_00310 [Bdellovibrio sp. CG10_big_fil_rev_8_21_14_0_10_47_8]|nr:MAG: hypothetical protein COT73_00310 [Bdellovibrio sp. CG10_big_fil_rev_8_21_14_0_10_47_8]
MADPRILITGAGSGVGQGILKSLRLSKRSLRLIMGDVHPLNSGLFRSDESLMIPRVESPNSLEEMIDVLNHGHIDMVLVGSEFDLDFFSKNRTVLESKTKAIIVASPHETVKLSNDKWLTYEFLKNAGIRCPQTHIVSNMDEALKIATDMGYPLVLKTRTGTSSRHVHVVKNEQDLIAHFPTTPRPILQEMIATPRDQLDAEYTCSIFKTKEGQLLGPFTARRTLRGGSSWMIEVAPFQELNSLLLEIGEKLPFMGSLNVQLMIGPKGPIPFEFNARFSGTTAVRAHYGFNEPDMVVRNYLFNEVLEQPQIQSGVAMRYLEEVFIDGVSAEQLLSDQSSRGIVRTWY